MINGRRDTAKKGRYHRAGLRRQKVLSKSSGALVFLVVEILVCLHNSKSRSQPSRMQCGWRQTSLRSRGTKHNRVFGTDEYFVLDEHAEAVRAPRESIGRDVYGYRQ